MEKDRHPSSKRLIPGPDASSRRSSSEGRRRSSGEGRRNQRSRTSSLAPRKTSAQSTPAGCCSRKNCNIKSQTGLIIMVLWIAYVFVGSLVFIYLEQMTEMTSVQRDHHHWAKFKELVSAGATLEELEELRYHLHQLCPHHHFNKTHKWLTLEDAQGLSTEDPSAQAPSSIVNEDWLRNIERECEWSLRIIEDVATTISWTLVDSLYFTMTLVTTIGYGNIVPTTRYGRMFSVLHALIGVPLTCILMAKSSEMLSNKMLMLYKSAKQKRPQRHHKRLLYGVTWLYLTVGFIVFMFLPSVAFVFLEDWNYDDALYCTFITLSTIGFGDYVPGYGSERPYGELYKLAIIVWIMVALGYWFLLLNFLTKALKSDVPRRIRRTLKGRPLSRQAEFLRQLLSKVKTRRGRIQQEASSQDGKDDEVVNFMLNVADSLGPETRRPRSRRVSLQVEGRDDTLVSEVEVEDVEEEEEEEEEGDAYKTRLRLQDLLEVQVTVKSREASTMLVSNSNSRDLDQLCYKPCNAPSEITMPLREVLQLVTLVKSMEEQEGLRNLERMPLHINTSDLGLDEEMSSPTGSQPSTVTSYDPRDSVPLLFTDQHRRNHHHMSTQHQQDAEKRNVLGLRRGEEEDDLQEYLEEDGVDGESEMDDTNLDSTSSLGTDEMLPV
ncbi:uncharacterized protein LOC143018218 [Oratosquilla oratoria]|uniref:uncharacterized protein LOC143018218 n=1 Tax=Oratosquilla oratoria TaxID=337810 RepID=UPI003F7770F6